MSRHLVEVALGDRSYPIHVGAGLIAEAGALIQQRVSAKNLLVVADARVAELHGRRLRDSLHEAGFKTHLATFAPGEPSKTLEQAERLWQACAEHRIDRSDAVVALGGGVSGDLAGFVAACWMRGVPLVQVPTTLLAMVDSAVGGKTGVNSAAGKNLIGAFKQPACVVIDTELVATMDAREYRAGLAEVLKYGVIRDATFFAWQEAHAEALESREPAAAAHAVAASCRIKADYVAEDEFERGARAELNYGHTFGHAIERDTAYETYLHGEAVGIGMRMAARLARTLSVLDEPSLIARQDRLLERFRLPLVHRADDPLEAARRLAGHCRLDKKVASGRTRFILPQRLGKVVLHEAPDEAAVVAAFAAAIEKG